MGNRINLYISLKLKYLKEPTGFIIHIMIHAFWIINTNFSLVVRQNSLIQWSPIISSTNRNKLQWNLDWHFLSRKRNGKCHLQNVSHFFMPPCVDSSAVYLAHNTDRIWVSIVSADAWVKFGASPVEHKETFVTHYSDITWASWCLKSLATRTACSGWEQRKHQSSALLVLCEGNPLVTSGFPSQTASNVESISMLCQLHAIFNDT